MRYLKATEARRRWFELLDDVIAGEEVVVERRGHRIVIRSDDRPALEGDVPDYSDVLQSRTLDQADRWSWEWTPAGTKPRVRK